MIWLTRRGLGGVTKSASRGMELVAGGAIAGVAAKGSGDMSAALWAI